jgi:Tol biopolymer transport system component
MIPPLSGCGTGQADFNPSWSPEGTKIAFTSDRDGNQEIYVMNADGTEQTNLTNDPGSDNYPDWSPDGSKIAFTSRRDGIEEIYVMNTDGAGPTRLTDASCCWSRNPSWSPDSTKIAFTAWREGQEQREQIYVMASDGSGQASLSDARGWEADWFPNGDKIAFSSKYVNQPGLNMDEIDVINSDGTNRTRLTNYGHAGGAAWSPNGTKITFHSWRDGTVEIYVMNADGSGQSRLTTDGGENPSWNP